MSLQWSESLATGFGKIDEQHKELINRYNDLLKACKEGRGRREIGEVLEFLGSYVVHHFSEEEQLMTKFAYPGIDQHVQQHKLLVEEVQKLQKDMSENGPSVSVLININTTLLNWLVAHIKDIDMQLGAFLQQHGKA